MRGLYILTEGQTEEQFTKDLLLPYFSQRGIYDVRPILMPTGKGQKGGAVNFARLQHNVNTLLLQERDIIVSTFIDFFRLSPDFPAYQEAIQLNDKISKVGALENGMAQTISNSRFVPYIQLHEFEGLLFTSTRGFDELPDIPESNRIRLAAAVNEHENPELLNVGENTAPSKRLEFLIPGYQKTLYGPFIAEINTLHEILEKCERFRRWLEGLEEKMKG